MIKDEQKQLGCEELNSDELHGGDDSDIIADIDSYQYSSEEIASFNKYVKRSSAAFGYNVYNNNENGKYSRDIYNL